jgi:hypothetical protein
MVPEAYIRAKPASPSACPLFVELSLIRSRALDGQDRQQVRLQNSVELCHSRIDVSAYTGGQA